MVSKPHSGSWQLLVIRTNGVWRSHQPHIVPAEIVLLANEVHPSDFKSSDRNTPCLRALPPASNQTKKEVSKPIQRRERRVIIHQQVWELRHQGLSGKAIAKKLGIGCTTVFRYLRHSTFQERNGRSDRGRSKLDPYKDYLLEQ